MNCKHFDGRGFCYYQDSHTTKKYCDHECGYKTTKDRIICLVGESGSGKSTIAELLEEEGYNYIESYTTRPPRYEGERGHIFVDEKELYGDFFDQLINSKNVIAYTHYNNHHYWAEASQYRGKGTSIYIVDTKGVEKLRETIKDAEIVVIYLKADVGMRCVRMKEERSIVEACQRLEHDLKKFKIIQCDYVVDANGTIKETLELVKQVIGGLE